MRLFVSLPLQKEMAEECIRLQVKLTDKGFSHVRWAKRDQLHLTLKFLGETPEEKLTEIEDALSREVVLSDKFIIRIGRGGCFPPRGSPRIVWIGFKDGTEELVSLASLCERRLVSLGFSAEKRPFSPHVTIGRVERNCVEAGLREALEKISPEPLAQTVSAIFLMKSTLHPKGSIYTEVKQFNLG